MLLSSVPTTSLDEVLERLAWYARRWTIERWHRVPKSGCRIEARQFGTLDRFVSFQYPIEERFRFLHRAILRH